MLFYTGIKRTASDVARATSSLCRRRERSLERLTELVDEGMAVLNGATTSGVSASFCTRAWQTKRSLSKMTSNAMVDEIYAAARSAGAIGGKLTGAGGGGFMLLFAPPERHRAIIERLQRLCTCPSPSTRRAVRSSSTTRRGLSGRGEDAGAPDAGGVPGVIELHEIEESRELI